MHGEKKEKNKAPERNLEDALFHVLCLNPFYTFRSLAWPVLLKCHFVKRSIRIDVMEMFGKTLCQNDNSIQVSAKEAQFAHITENNGKNRKKKNFSKCIKIIISMI